MPSPRQQTDATDHNHQAQIARPSAQRSCDHPGRSAPRRKADTSVVAHAKADSGIPCHSKPAKLVLARVAVSKFKRLPFANVARSMHRAGSATRSRSVAAQPVEPCLLLIAERRIEVF